ncbi:MAG: hypothetical protein EA369_04255 [Bradymonadales bacterium]|nr:MAG: hypothetical protein EA369_04255 [Bradymonadales bacterium]
MRSLILVKLFLFVASVGAPSDPAYPRPSEFSYGESLGKEFSHGEGVKKKLELDYLLEGEPVARARDMLSTYERSSLALSEDLRNLVHSVAYAVADRPELYQLLPEGPAREALRTALLRNYFSYIVEQYEDRFEFFDENHPGFRAIVRLLQNDDELTPLLQGFGPIRMEMTALSHRGHRRFESFVGDGRLEWYVSDSEPFDWSDPSPSEEPEQQSPPENRLTTSIEAGGSSLQNEGSSRVDDTTFFLNTRGTEIHRDFVQGGLRLTIAEFRDSSGDQDSDPDALSLEELIQRLRDADDDKSFQRYGIAIARRWHELRGRAESEFSRADDAALSPLISSPYSSEPSDRLASLGIFLAQESSSLSAIGQLLGRAREMGEDLQSAELPDRAQILAHLAEIEIALQMLRVLHERDSRIAIGPASKKGTSASSPERLTYSPGKSPQDPLNQFQ